MRSGKIASVSDEQDKPQPLTYASPQPRRSFHEALTDHVIQEAAANRLHIPTSRHRAVAWTIFAIVVLLLIAALFLM
jgi:hypothetical protein